MKVILTIAETELVDTGRVTEEDGPDPANPGKTVKIRRPIMERRNKRLTYDGPDGETEEAALERMNALVRGNKGVLDARVVGLKPAAKAEAPAAADPARRR